MTHAKFEAITESIFHQIRDMAVSKGREYAGDAERFDNFNRLAVRTGLRRQQVWQVYFTKHLDAIETFIREEGKVPTSEPILGRIVDALTYLMLLYGMVVEDSQKKPASYAWVDTSTGEFGEVSGTGVVWTSGTAKESGEK